MKRSKLSDGTTARKGLYVVVITGESWGCRAGTVTCITDISPVDYNGSEYGEQVVAVKYGIKGSTMLEVKTDLRKATAAEIKAYKQKYK